MAIRLLPASQKYAIMSPLLKNHLWTLQTYATINQFPTSHLHLSSQSELSPAKYLHSHDLMTTMESAYRKHH